MRGLTPTRRAVALALGGALIAALPVLVDPRLALAWLGFVLALLVALGLDALLAPRLRDLAPTFAIPATLVVACPQAIALTFPALGGRRPLPIEAEIEGDPVLGAQGVVRGRVDPQEGATLTATLQPVRRGAWSIDRVWLRWKGPLGLAERVARVPVGRLVTVVPDLSATRRAALALDRARHVPAGLKVERYLGDGSEFDAMREYVAGLDPRSISWRATARHRRLVCHQFRAERNHPVVIAVDTGRLMGEVLAGTTRLDHALHAGLLLAWTALRTGDRVGFYAFDALPRAWQPPEASRSTFATLRHAAAALAYGTDETNFTLGLLELTQRLERRTLILLLTDIVDAIGAELLLENVERLVRRHVVVFATLADPDLAAAAAAAPEDEARLARAVIAERLRRERGAVLQRLARRGVLVLDAPPSRLGPDLVSRYLEAKRRERV